MQDIIIVCAGSYGKEVYYELLDINKAAKENKGEDKYRLLGFLSDVPDALEGSGIELPILGTIQEWQPKSGEKYVLGLGKPESKKKVAGLLKDRGAVFESVVSVFARVPKDLIMGEGCFITSAMISCGVQLGDFVNINGSMLYGGAQIGDYSTTTGFTVVEDAKVGVGVYLGSKSVVTQGCTVGNWVRVTAGSVITKDVQDGAMVFGMPAEEVIW